MRFLTLLLLSVLWFSPSAFAVEPVKDNTYTESNTAIAISVDQPEFTIKLKSNPTTGYSWFLRDYNAALIESVSHAFQAPTDKKLMGAPGFEVWKFKVKPAAYRSKRR
jgi:inhibitor of cysteine peptidase